MNLKMAAAAAALLAGLAGAASAAGDAIGEGLSAEDMSKMVATLKTASAQAPGVAGAPAGKAVRANKRAQYSQAQAERDKLILEDLARLIKQANRIAPSSWEELSTLQAWIDGAGNPSLTFKFHNDWRIFECEIAVDPKSGIALKRPYVLDSAFGPTVFAGDSMPRKVMAKLALPQDLENSPFMIEDIPSLGGRVLYKPLVALAVKVGDISVAMVDEVNWQKAILKVAGDKKLEKAP